MTRPHELVRFPPGRSMEIQGYSFMRVALVSDDPPPGTDDEVMEAINGVWHMFADSIERRRLVAKGAWALGIVDKPEHWRDHIFGAVRDQIEAQLRDHPEHKVVMVIGLFDTGEANVKPHVVKE